MDGYLSKPFSRPELKTIFDHYLVASESPTSSACAAEPPIAERTDAGAEITDDPQELALEFNAETIEMLKTLPADDAANLFEKLVAMFGPNATGLLNDAIQGYTEGNYEQVRNAIHTLKSSSGNLGAVTLMAYCAEVEKDLREERYTALPQQLDRMTQLVNDSIAGLHDQL
jgi:HPt (histidine-containing phosphotransfer) domain-containing protein